MLDKHICQSLRSRLKPLTVMLCKSVCLLSPCATQVSQLHQDQPIQRVFMECHPFPSCWKSYGVPALTISSTGRAVGWELLSCHNPRDPQQQPLCPAQQDRPWAVPCWEAQLPWHWHSGNFSTRNGANTAAIPSSLSTTNTMW